jgi:hypothetical protein
VYIFGAAVGLQVEVRHAILSSSEQKKLVIGGMNGFSRFLHDSIETVDRVSSVTDCAQSTIGLDQTVLAPDHVTVSDFPLILLITSMRVIHSVSKTILGSGLQFIAHHKSWMNIMTLKTNK